MKQITDFINTIEGDRSNVRVRYNRNLVQYENNQGKQLEIVMLYPDEVEVKQHYPIVIHIQGSAWFKQNLNCHVLDFKDIVRSGYIVAIVEYSCLPNYIFPQQIEDAKCAIHHLCSQANELSIDLDNVFISGDSSGGHTALMCWTTWGQSIFDNANERLPNLRGCIDLYGVVDLATTMIGESEIDHSAYDSAEALLLGGVRPEDDSSLATQASVITYLDTATAPLLVMHGDQDSIVPFTQSIQLLEACLIANKPITFYQVMGANHGDSVFFSETTMQAILTFLQNHTRRIS